VAARSGAGRARVAPCACVLGCVCGYTQRVLGEMPQGLGRVAWSPHMVRPWRGSWHDSLARGTCEGAQARAPARCMRAGARMVWRGGGVASDGAARQGTTQVAM
jgi:hypothetical protein